MKKLFIFGVGGLLGYRIAQLSKKDFKVYGSYNQRNPKLDFGNFKKIDIHDRKIMKEELSSINPDYVINTLALSNVDYCESNEEKAREVNVQTVKEIFQLCEKLNCKLIHISSDSVFDGTNEYPYTEEDKPKPMNVYGKTKFESEKIVLKNSNNLIIRASVLYGWHPYFLAKVSSSSMKHNNFAQWLIQNLKNQKNVNIITDEISSPILVDDFARSIIYLIKGNFKGIYHSAPSIQISRYDFSIKIAEHLGLNKKYIHPVSNKELGRNVNTGKNKCLDSTKIKSTGFKFLSLEESMEKLKKNID